MQQRASALNAAIEVLIAGCSPNNVQTIAHQSTMMRLGDSVDDKGEMHDVLSE